MIRIGNSKKTASAILAYPGFAYPSDQFWRVHVAGIVWQTPVIFNRRQRMMIRMLGGVMQATPDEMEGEMFQSRITPFMAEADHRQSVIVTINGRGYRLRKRTRRNGHFYGWIQVPRKDIEAVLSQDSGRSTVPCSVAIEDEKTEPSEGTIHLYQRRGVSVISDIDDTIKDSDVGDRRKLLANTFLKEFRTVPGMSSVYQDWSTHGASFHYVSSSPWQLFESLHQMHFDHGFPLGTMHLRNFRLRDQFLRKVMIRRQGKASAIKLLIKSMPGRDFVLVGDSGEKDASIYAKVCRKYPDRVKGVFIRNLNSHPIEREQLDKLTESLPGGKVATFADADELKRLGSQVI